MPELPEVETIRRDLDHDLAGRTVETVAATGRRTIRRHVGPDQFGTSMVGRRVASVQRRGKYLLLRCPTPAENQVGASGPDATGPAGCEAVLVVHLGMSGQLLLSGCGDPVPVHTHVVVGFGAGRELRFVDPRTFGEVFVSSVPAGAELLPELAHLGLDPLEEITSPSHLGALLRGRRAMLKPLLMDQRFLAGIGNMYADEILFAARLRYDRRSEDLSGREVARLHRAVSDTLLAAIRHRGSSLADQQYRDVFGVVGGYQQHHQVYGREGRPCPRCAQAIVRVKTAGRSSFLCLRCQR